MAKTRKMMTVTLTGDEYNAIVFAIAAIGGRAFGAQAARDGVDPLAVMTDAAVEQVKRIGGAGVGELMQRMGNAAEAAKMIRDGWSPWEAKIAAERRVQSRRREAAIRKLGHGPHV